MKSKDKSPKIKETVKTVVGDLLDKLEISAAIEVLEEKNETDENNFKVNIKTEETGLLIGRHGEIINSLQLLTGVILYKKTGGWHRVILNVGDYRETREESIKQMAERIVTEVEATNEQVVLPILTPYERRIVHLLLASSKTVVSESIGEGKDRRLVIKPK